MLIFVPDETPVLIHSQPVSCWQLKLKILLASVLLSFSVLGACVLDTPGCACGAQTNDPFSQHDQSYEGSHIVADECVCQCGLEILFSQPRDRQCSEYELACEDSTGTPQTLVCE